MTEMMRINVFAGADILVDGVQLEELSKEQLESQNYQTDYRDYGAANLVYLKKPPAYYNCQGRPDDPAVCAQFASICHEDELNCQWYTPLNNDPKVPAVAKYPVDYCPAECAGYQTYKQEPTFFEKNGHYPLYFIASTAQKCSANYAGCDEFTNLDEVAKGGEGLEYYSYLRQCQKPDQADCATYYTWIGSDNTGYQLKVYQLRKSNLDNAPCTHIEYDDSGNPFCQTTRPR